ncbi:MAG: hypothetical protein K0A99_12235, partial [Desulfoarculaceae bacterium]|nr:hypothetical protein [Desulfoarculaceae bacterium]
MPKTWPVSFKGFMLTIRGGKPSIYELQLNDKVATIDFSWIVTKDDCICCSQIILLFEAFWYLKK